MRFEKSHGAQRTGFILGYASSYLLFTGMLFLILTLTHKVAGPFGLPITAGITAGVAIVGETVRRLLQ